MGQEPVTRTLMNAIKAGRVAHAILFTGARGVGKTSAARIMAKGLNCEHGPTPRPCNDCALCREVDDGSSVDVLEIDGASNNSVDNIRELRENVKYHPAKARTKIYIIDEVHMLSGAAFNALLKTLEEPPPHVQFIFATTEPHKIPTTVQSRCQRFDFKRIPAVKISGHLSRITEAEAVQLSQASIALIARQAEGSMRDALSMLDQVIAFGGKEISDQDVVEVLGVVDRESMFKLSDAILKHNPVGCLEIVERICAHGYELRHFTTSLIEHLRNMTVVKVCPNQEVLLELPGEELERLREQVSEASLETLERLFHLAVRSATEIAHSSYPRLLLEMALIKLSHVQPIQPLDDILDRLESLERSLDGGDYQPSSSSVAAPPANEAPRRAPGSGVPDSSAQDGKPAERVAGSAEEWRRIVKSVGERSSFVASAFELGELIEITGERIKIGFNTKQGQFAIKGARDNKDKFEELFGKLSGRRISLEIVESAEESAFSNTLAEQELRQKEREKASRLRAAADHPGVQQAREAFGAEISDVRLEEENR